MFKSYASKITSFLIENKEINQDDYEVYKYGFEVLIAFIDYKYIIECGFSNIYINDFYYFNIKLYRNFYTSSN